MTVNRCRISSSFIHIIIRQISAFMHLFNWAFFLIYLYVAQFICSSWLRFIMPSVICFGWFVDLLSFNNENFWIPLNTCIHKMVICMCMCMCMCMRMFECRKSTTEKGMLIDVVISTIAVATPTTAVSKLASSLFRISLFDMRFTCKEWTSILLWFGWESVGGCQHFTNRTVKQC